MLDRSGGRFRGAGAPRTGIPTRSVGTIKTFSCWARKWVVGCADEEGASFAIDALRTSAHPMALLGNRNDVNFHRPHYSYNSDAGLEFIQDHKLWNDSANLGMKKPMRLEPHRLVCPTRRTLSNYDACCPPPQKYGNWRTLNHENYAAIADCTQYTKFEICIRSFLRFWRHGVLYERQKPCPNQNTFSM